jgi:hypothetical protein
VLLILAAALWWHRWVPVLLLAGVVSWGILHRRLEGNPGRVLGRLWRRAWPPRTLALILLLSGGTLAYWVSDEPITPKLLPIALNIVALSIMLFGNWWTLFAHSRRFRTAGRKASGPSGGASMPGPAHDRSPLAGAEAGTGAGTSSPVAPAPA